MKAFIVSMPRSGTYLMGKLLTIWGMTDTHYHFSEGFVEHRTQENIDRQRVDLSDVHHNTDDYWSNIPDNAFAVGHLAPTTENVSRLSTFKRICLIRNRSEVEYSLRSWSKHIGHNIELTNDHIKIPDWRFVNYTFLMDFNTDIIDINVNKLNLLQKYLFNDVIHDSKLTMQQAQGAMTFTKSELRP